jgi:copper transport protein
VNRAAIRLAFAVVAAVLASASLASTAFAHADLLRSSPRDGQTFERSPRAVELTFDEGIEPAFVRLRVQDAAGRRVDRGEPYHPGDREEVLAVRLRPGLDGRYAASYRVISSDGHPVTRQIRFNVRPAAPAPAEDERERDEAAPPAEMERTIPPPAEETPFAHEESESGSITSAAFATARGLGYLAMALAIGGVVFLLIVWLPALARLAEAGSDWSRLSERFARRVRTVVVGAVLLGLVATALAIVLEGATAAGVSFWAALDPDVIDLVSETRVVQAWTARLVVWVLLGGLVLALLRPRRMPVLRRASLGAEGTALSGGLSRTQALLLFAVIAALALTAPLGGHAASHSPRGLLVGSDTVHVLAMCTWLGGLVLLLLALAVTARSLSPGDRTPLMATVVGRFSRMATIVVPLLLLTGIVNSIVLVASFEALVQTAYGRLVLAKIALVLALLSLGAVNQRRTLPRLKALAAGGVEPGRAALVLRRAVSLEVALVLLVLGVTSVLVATQPAAAG